MLAEAEAMRLNAERRSEALDKDLRETEERLQVEAQLRQDLNNELEAERQQYRRALDERDFGADQSQQHFKCEGLHPAL